MDKIKQLFKEFSQHLLMDEKPSIYLKSMLKAGVLSELYPYSLLGELLAVPQNPKYHPEGSVWNHTLLVVDNAASYKNLSNNQEVLMWAALLHDLGKIKATKIRKGRIVAYDHDSLGEEMSIEFLKKCDQNDSFIYAVSKMVRWHMQMLYILKDLPFSDVDSMMRDIDLEELSILCLCDRLGRGNIDKESIEKEKNNVKLFKEKCLVMMDAYSEKK